MVDLEYRTANACYKDAADLHADLDEHPQAIARYEQVADHSLNSALTKYSVKEYWLKAGLCALAMNVHYLPEALSWSEANSSLGPCYCAKESEEVHNSGCDIWVNSRI